MCSGEVIRLLKCGHSQAHFKTHCGRACSEPTESEYFEIDDTCHECTAGHKIFAARTFYERYVAETEAERTADNSHELDHTFNRLRLALDEEETKILKHSPTNEETLFLPHSNMTDFELSCEWVEGKCIWSDPPIAEPRALRRVVGIYPGQPYHYYQPRSEPDSLGSLSSLYLGETTDYIGDDDESCLSGPDGFIGSAGGEIVDWLAVADRQVGPETVPPVPAHRPQGPRRMPTKLPSLPASGRLDPAVGRKGAAAGQQPTPYRIPPYRRGVCLAQTLVPRRTGIPTPATTTQQDRQEERPLIASDAAQPSFGRQKGSHGEEDEYQYDGFERWAQLKETLKKRGDLA